jgi:hypothetical protein
MGHQVRTHTRRLPSGRTVTVRQHVRDDDGLPERDHDKRDRFEQRVLRERQAERKAARTGKQPARVPGEKRHRPGRAVTRAKRHVRKAAKLWRKHKVRAVAYGALALAEITAHGAARAWKAGAKAARRLRGRRK